jgi:hypothetical protein
MNFRTGAVAASVAALLLGGCSSNSGPVTVSGTVVDLSGHPFAGQTVVISSGTFSRTQVTDVTGAFSVEGVPTPYNATVVDSGGERVTSYQGLTRTDPTLTDAISQSPNRRATLGGQLTGGTYPESDQLETTFAFSSPETFTPLAALSSGSYQAQVQWSGPETTSGTLYALQLDFGAQPGPGYLGYGVRENVALADMGTSTGQDVALSPVTSGTLSGTVTAAPGYSVYETNVQLLVAPTVPLFLFGFAYIPSGGSPFSYVTPSIEGTSLLLSEAAQGPAGAYVATQMALSANATGVALTLPAAPTLNLPADGATGVTPTTSFSWTAFPSGVHVFQVYSGGSAFLLVTSASTATLADFSPQTPLSSATYTWDVIGYAPAASVDALAAAGGLHQFLFGNITEGHSASRTFTTGP